MLPARARVQARWVIALAGTLAVIALGMALYGDALRLPFFWDDVMHIEWLKQASLPGVWSGPQAGVTYYRPLVFTVWKVMEALQGGYDSAWQHGLNVALHGVNAGLTGLVARNQSAGNRTAAGLAAGAVFLAFPFSFQAVIPVNSLTHPLHTLFILASVAGLQAALADKSRTGALASAVCAAGAMFAHDNGIVAPALLLLAGAMHPTRPSLAKLARVWLPIAAVWSLAAIAWFLLRNPGGDVGIAAAGFVDSGLTNFAYFAQGLSFPGAVLVERVTEAGRSVDPAQALAVCLLMAGLWAGAAGIARGARSAAFGLAWWFLAILPSCLFLGSSYALQSPRLSYLAAAGFAIFAAAPLSGPISPGWRHPAQFIGALGVVATVIWGVAYIQPRLALYSLLGESIRQLGAEASNRDDCGRDSRAEILAVNFPAWFFQARAEYALGYDGIATVSEGSSLGRLQAVNYGDDPGLSPAVLPDAQQAGAPYVGLGPRQTLDSLAPALRAARSAILTTFSGGGMRTARVGCLRSAGGSPGVDYLARFGPLDLAAAAARRDKGLEITLDWSLRALPDEDVTVFAHILDASGALIAQLDGYPLAGMSPPRLWQMGDIWRDRRQIAADPGLLAAASSVRVGVYRTGSGVRLSAIGADGARLPDDAYTLSIK